MGWIPVLDSEFDVSFNEGLLLVVPFDRVPRPNVRISLTLGYCIYYSPIMGCFRERACTAYRRTSVSQAYPG